MLKEEMHTLLKNQDRTLFISVSGNIGSGKTTFIEELCRHFNGYIVDRRIVYLSEPNFSKSRRISNEYPINTNNEINILDIFYTDPNKYAFPFQVYAYCMRVKKIYKLLEKYPDEKLLIITERSLLDDKKIFMYANIKYGHIDEKIIPIYDLFYNFLAVDIINCEIGRIFLKVNNEICIERIKKRNRIEENNIDKDYIALLDQYQNEMISSIEKYSVFELDWNQNKMINNALDINNDINTIKNYIIECIKNHNKNNI